MNSAVVWTLGLLLAAPPEHTINFDTEIVPVLTHAGCNSGACHGAAAGRGGFRLSLLGADPEADYQTIVHEFESRRVNVAHPDRSLLLAKPTGELNHGGGMVLTPHEAGAARLLAWIEAGAPRGSRRELTDLQVTPRREVTAALGEQIPLCVTARFDEGPPEDVTAWTVFLPSDPSALEVDQDHQVRIKRRGRHTLIVRYLGRVIPVQFNVPYAEFPVDLSHEPRQNLIDDEVLRMLTELRIPVSPPASDEAWLRRVTLDLTGRLPDPEAMASFLMDQAPTRRERRVDLLLSSEEFADYWTLRLARLLRIRSLPNEPEGVRAYAHWLRRELADGTGLDKIARALLTATGDSHVVGPANFGRMVNDPRGHAELVGEFFLGVQLGCANCHNHPLDRWTQDDYHGLAAVFARLERGRFVQVAARGAVTNLRTGEPALPRIPGVRTLTSGEDHRQEFADWLLNDPQLSFARAMVNRLWQSMFGRGLVDPTDDLRETNPATHPELLDHLARDFVEHGYDLRHTLKLIALSSTYGRSSSVVAGNEQDDRFYSRSYWRPLPPEVLADAFADVTGVPESYAGHPPGTRAVALVDPLTPSYALDLLGRCARARGCDSDTLTPGLAAELHLLNGDFINQKLASPEGRLHRLLADGRSDAEILREFFSRAFSRSPSDDELTRWTALVAGENPIDRKQRLEDFLWSLLTSRQFMGNH